MFSSPNTIFQFWRIFWQKFGTKNNNKNNNNNRVILKIAYALHARDQKRSLDTTELFWKHESAEGIVIIDDRKVWVHWKLQAVMSEQSLSTLRNEFCLDKETTIVKSQKWGCIWLQNWHKQKYPHTCTLYTKKGKTGKSLL